MKIAIVGAGISGLVAARLLAPEHDVIVYEAGTYVGGHTHTVDVSTEDGDLAIDTGFIVYNERTYPAFCGLLAELGVASQPTLMGFGVRCDRCGLEYSGSSLRGLLARKRNLLSLGFHRMLSDIVRFNRAGEVTADPGRNGQTVGEFLKKGRYSSGFAEHYLLPMGAAIWSCPMETFETFPMQFILEFYRNHGLMQVYDRPVWRVIRGGSREYLGPLTKPFADRIRLQSSVRRVWREADSVCVEINGDIERFDEVVFACHSDQALQILRDPDGAERAVLRAFPYSRNTATLHTDISVLPRRKAAWASWNYRIPAGREERPRTTYNMNILQGLKSSKTFCVSLNEDDSISQDEVLGSYQYSHPVFTLERASAQSRHPEMIRRNRISYCGAYWGNGFHEDGVQSAIAVAQRFGVVPDWAGSDSRRPAKRPPEERFASTEAADVR
jgi:predicted NAD/FAD-binding protein